MTLHIRKRDPRGTADLIAHEMQRLAPDVFIDISPMAETISVAVLPARIGAVVTAAFGVVAMLLSASAFTASWHSAWLSARAKSAYGRRLVRVRRTWYVSSSVKTSSWR
jgi:hypothetical protein